jgi:hypothetical protein
MNLGKYEIETYYVVVNGQTETRQRIVYTGINEEDIAEHKREYFRFLKPTVDAMINEFF